MNFKNTWTGNWENALRGLRHPMESYARSDSEFGITECYGDETYDLEDAWLEKKDFELHKQYNSYDWLEDTEDKYICECEKIGDWLWENGVIQGDSGTDYFEYAFIGPNDMDLAQRMIKAGTPNDKFLRQIFVSVDITAPEYFWSQLDTYKVGTVANSTSKMHRLANTPITIDCFEIDDYVANLEVEKWATSAEYLPYSDEAKGLEINEYIKGQINFYERLRQLYLETKDIRYWKELVRWLPEGWLQTRTWTANYSILRNIYHWRKDHKLSEWHQFCDWISTLPYANELLIFEN